MHTSVFSLQGNDTHHNKPASIRMLPLYIPMSLLYAILFRCEVFRAMLSVSNGDDDANSPMILSEIHPNIFLAVLEYIYTNCCSLSTNMVSNIAGTCHNNTSCISDR